MNINNPKIWSITDGSDGMISQTRGLAFELSNDVTEIKTDIIFPWNKMQPGILPVYSWIFKNNIPKSNIPDIVISCGRKSVYLSTYLKKKFNKLINIHIQNPKISSKKFTFIVAPNHDNFTGENVINSTGALHHFKIEKEQKNSSESNSKKIVSCIIGGQNNHYKFTRKEALNFCKKIEELKHKNSNLEFLIITSRRTSEEVKNLLNSKLNKVARLWLGKGENPYKFALYNSKFFIITSDSTSMISEATVSGKPIYIYQLPSKRKIVRFNRFHDEFRKRNITKDFLTMNDLEYWSYEKLDESKRIAGIIKKRIIEGKNEFR